MVHLIFFIFIYNHIDYFFNTYGLTVIDVKKLCLKMLMIFKSKGDLND